LKFIPHALGFRTLAYFLAVDVTSGSYLLAFLLISMSALLIAIFLCDTLLKTKIETISAGSFLLRQDNRMG
jgi:hypothetical protein